MTSRIEEPCGFRRDCPLAELQALERVLQHLPSGRSSWSSTAPGSGWKVGEASGRRQQRDSFEAIRQTPSENVEPLHAEGVLFSDAAGLRRGF